MHQCVHCSFIYPDASRELLEGCSNNSCGSRFFYYIKKMPEKKEMIIPMELSVMDKKQVEKDVREMMGAQEEDVPVILDLESIRIAGPGKFEIDVVNLLDKKRPLIYKLDEGKYVIDLASTLKVNLNEINKKIRKPKRMRKEEKNG
ncbi:MAG: Zn-ribbon containing protein [Nanoarchaeota archaeon]